MNIMIMAGGKGERFWPKSTMSRPKQLLPIVSEQSMIEETVERLIGLVDYHEIFISTNANLVEEIKNILPRIPGENFIIEPEGRDTAPAIGLGAAYIHKRSPGSIMIVLPADHLILDKEIFQKDLATAEQIAKKTSCLITFGIKPSRPETGYGYIELGEVINEQFDNPAYEVKSFKEKPDEATAQQYLQQGNFAWNSGMFVWSTNVILEAMEKCLPEMSAGLMEIQEAIDTKDKQEVIGRIFRKFNKISIDYGVMEKADNVLCLRSRFPWDDVGAWSALSRVSKADKNNNLIRTDWEGIDTKDSILINDKGIIATIGIKDLLVVKQGDSLLIADKSREQEVKKIVTKLKENQGFKKYIE